MSDNHEELLPSGLSEIEQRCKTASPGPWKSYVESRDHFSGSDFIQTASEDIYLTGASVADQEFIAHSRQDVPRLLDEVRRLQAMLDAWKRSA